MSRVISFIYGVIEHIGFLLAFLYMIGFLGNFLVPKSVDSGEEGSVGAALFINVLLLVILGVQHSVMARPGFKKWWTKIVPQHIERSTYVVISDVLVFLMVWLWQPMTGVIWHVENQWGAIVLWVLFGIGWLAVVLSSFMINHFDLLGTR